MEFTIKHEELNCHDSWYKRVKIFVFINKIKIQKEEKDSKKYLLETDRIFDQGLSSIRSFIPLYIYPFEGIPFSYFLNSLDNFTFILN